MNWAEIRAMIIAKSEVVDGGCWIWTGATKRPGKRYAESHGTGYNIYPRLSKNLPVKIDADGNLKETAYAHIAALAADLEEPIPFGYDVAHKCNTRLCVNHNHLEIQTHTENMRGVGFNRAASDAELTAAN